MQRKLDRIYQHDDNNTRFRSVAGLEELDIRRKMWRCETWNDQGQEGACVGFGWGHELAAHPIVYPADYGVSMAIYNRAKVLDPWAGEDYDGTSVLAGAKAVMELKNYEGVPLLDAYQWAFDVRELIQTLVYKGPIVFGTNWYDDMWDTDSGGFVHASGELMGGHCLLIRGFRPGWKDSQGPAVFDNLDFNKSFVVLRNSWGRGWGVDGDCRLLLTDLDKLLSEDGEACIPVGRHN